jgi:hypothetical protein
METEDDPLPKPSTKRKPPKVEESCSKKEHVNVVFIGHVGMFLILLFMSHRTFFLHKIIMFM